MKEIPSYQEAIADPDKILEFQATAGLKFGSWSMFFNDDSVSHPAKMNLRMLEWIIDNYSKPGDLIMDMFAGTGSTLIMASRKGRDAIGVELEQHFIDTMIVPNIKTSQSQTLLSGKQGKIVIVKGDSRRLDLIIPQAIDAIITSPPYSEMEVFSSDSKERTKRFKKELDEKGHIEVGGRKYTREEWLKANHGRMDGRSVLPKKGFVGYSDPDNIGNMSHGEVDSIITSPPYGTKAFADKQWMIDNIPEIEQRIREGKTKGNPRSPKAEIKHLEKIKDIEHPDSIDNIDDYGQVDTIVSSPPYGKMEMSKKFKSEKEKLAWAEKQSLINGRSVKAVLANLDRWKDWGEDTDNLGNMEHGNIDTVISSPPYGAMLSKRSGGDDRPEAMRRVMEENWGYSPKMVDKILAGETNVGAFVTRRGYNYSADDANIGNLPMGNVDKTIETLNGENSGILPHVRNRESMVVRNNRRRRRNLSGQNQRPKTLQKRIHLESKDRDRKLGLVDPIGNQETDRKTNPKERITLTKQKAVLPNKHDSEFHKRDSTSDTAIHDIGVKERSVKSSTGSSSVSKKRKKTDQSGRSKTRRDLHRTEKSPQEHSKSPTITGEIDSVISSPPYEGSLEERGGTQQRFKQEKGTPAPYSKDPENIGNKTGETYLEAMFKVYLGCWLVMKEGGTMVIVVKNFVRKGKPVRLDLDTIKLCEAAGFKLTDRWWFRLPFRSFWTIQHTKKWSELHPDSKEHPYAIFEDLLIFSREPLGDR